MITYVIGAFPAPYCMIGSSRTVSVILMCWDRPCAVLNDGLRSVDTITSTRTRTILPALSKSGMLLIIVVAVCIGEDSIGCIYGPWCGNTSSISPQMPQPAVKLHHGGSVDSLFYHVGNKFSTSYIRCCSESGCPLATQSTQYPAPSGASSTDVTPLVV